MRARGQRISQQGAAITDEEMAVLDVPFGQGVGASYMVGAGIRAAANNGIWISRDSLYTGYSQGMVLVNAARIQNRYQNEYGAYGRTQYRKDIEEALASGTLDENYANALRKALASAADVYQLGIDPMDFEGISSRTARGGAPGHRDDGRIHAHERDGG